jgi:hypothetical protein
MIESQTKIALCTTLQEEVTRHKDEMDSLREAAAKVRQYETSIESYKKKLEGIDFLKRSMKDLEDKNEELNKVRSLSTKFGIDLSCVIYSFLIFQYN